MTTKRYRAWCLSWGEEEEHGADVVGYDILSHDHAKQERGVVYVANFALGEPGDAAEAYADHVHSERDGYESSWPLVFRVRCPDGSTQDFEVDREYVPEFSARQLPQGEAREEDDENQDESPGEEDEEGLRS